MLPEPGALVPVAVVTEMWTEPVPGGAVAVIDPGELRVNDVALAEPKWTALAPPKLLPVIVTVVPPATGPSFGDTFETTGPASP